MFITYWDDPYYNLIKYDYDECGVYDVCNVYDFDFESVLRSLHCKVDWSIEEQRQKFLPKFLNLICDWVYTGPSIRGIFQPEEMDWLLTEDMKNKKPPTNYCKLLVDYVKELGYKDEPELDEAGKPVLQRTTPVHYAARQAGYDKNILDKLFEIYDRYDVNFIDESGLSHFHVACEYGCRDVVQKFLELGQDPNVIWRETGDSPLLLAAARGRKDVTELLLRHGADPNTANENGSTPLGVICKSRHGDDLIKILFEIADGKHQTVQVDVKDNLGRTPLQWAVAKLWPDVVEALLDHGADLSSFVFPTEIFFHELIESKLELASRALCVVESLEKRGFELDRSDALTIIKIFAKHVGFDKTASSKKYWYNNKRFVSKAKELTLNPSLTLYDLTRLRPEEAVRGRLVTLADCLEFARSDYRDKNLPHELALAAYLCEIVTRKFSYSWGLEFFLTLTDCQLPILCCEKIIGHLNVEDLWRVCLAATDRAN